MHRTDSTSDNSHTNVSCVGCLFINFAHDVSVNMSVPVGQLVGNQGKAAEVIFEGTCFKNNINGYTIV